MELEARRQAWAEFGVVHGDVGSWDSSLRAEVGMPGCSVLALRPFAFLGTMSSMTMHY